MGVNTWLLIFIVLIRYLCNIILANTITSRSTLKKKCHIFWFHCLPLGGSTNFRSQKMDMKTVDTLACFSDSKMSNNFVNNKAIEKNQKGL